MVLGEYFYPKIETSNGKKSRGSVCAVEPVADIAVIAEPDGQMLGDAWESYLDFVTTTKPVLLSLLTFPIGKSRSIHVLTHKRNWGEGTATRYGVPGALPSASVGFQATLIEGGTSGGPFVDDRGRLIGVVSHSGGAESATEHTGTFPVVHLALPRWILDQVIAAQKAVPAKNAQR